SHRLRSQTVAAGGLGAGPGAPRDSRLVQHRSYRYRSDGYITGIDDHLAGARDLDLDPAGRITAVHGPSWSERYAYHAAGDITFAAWPLPPGGPGDPGGAGDGGHAGTWGAGQGSPGDGGRGDDRGVGWGTGHSAEPSAGWGAGPGFGPGSEW